MPSKTEHLNLLIPEIYKPLQPLEVRLIEGCTQGHSVSGNYDGTTLSEQDNIIRGIFLVWVCGDIGVRKLIHHSGIDVEHAVIKGEVDLECATIDFPLRIKNSKFTHEINLKGASIINLDLSGSHLQGGLTADLVKTHASFFLEKGFISDSEVSLRGAEIRGNLNCTNGEFHGRGGSTINATLSRINGSVFLEKSTHVNGIVQFHEADIRGSFVCDGARLESQTVGEFDEPVSLSLERAKVVGSVFLRRNFSANGTVRLQEAGIEGSLDCEGGKFTAKKDAIIADGIIVTGPVLMRNGFAATGCVHLYGAKLGIELDCDHASFRKSPAANESECFIGSNMSINGALKWLNMPHLPEGDVVFYNARAKSFLTNTDSWIRNKVMNRFIFGILKSLAFLFPRRFFNAMFTKTYVNMDGFEYDNMQFENDDAGADKRLENRLIWLNLRGRTHRSLQPYSQVIKTLKASGHDAEARKVAIERERQRNTHLPWWQRFSRMFLLGLTVDYGYSPLKAIMFMLFLIWLGYFIFGSAKSNGVILPTHDRLQWGQQEPFPYPSFEPLAYSIDVFLPIVDLHQEEYWLPSATEDHSKFKTIYYMWLHIALGWILTTIFVSAITGLIKTETD